jgi:hypothetical protein
VLGSMAAALGRERSEAVSDRKCDLCGYERKHVLHLADRVWICDVCARQAAAFFDLPLAAPVSEEEGSEGRCGECSGAGVVQEMDPLGGVIYPPCPKCAPAPPPSTGPTPEVERIEKLALDGCGATAEETLSLAREVQRLRSLLATPEPPPSTGDEARDLLAEVVRLMPWHISGQPGQGPGHGHAIPGIWDDDHPPGKRGTPCEWCVLWTRIRALLASPSPRAQTGTGPSEEQLAEWERLAAEATPGPWETDPNDTVASAGGMVVADCYMSFDGEFIASASTAVPALVSEVRRLRSAALRREEREPRDAVYAFADALRAELGLDMKADPTVRRWLVEAWSHGSRYERALSSPATNPEVKP